MHISYYQTADADCQQQERELQRAGNRLSFWRGNTFAAALVFCFLGYRRQIFPFYACASTALLAFLLLVRKHQKLELRQRSLASRHAVIKDYLARFDDGWKNFPTDGARYLDSQQPETGDLDLFGRHSIYQCICTASTTWGQDQLARWLSLPKQQAVDIQKRQQAVRELAQKPAFTERYETAARSLRAIPYETARQIQDDFFRSLEQAQRFCNTGKAAIWIFPAVTLSFLALCLAGYRQEITMPCFLLFAFMQLMASFIGAHWNNRLLAPVYRMNQAVSPYQQLLELPELETFESPYLRALQQNLLSSHTSASGSRSSTIGNVSQAKSAPGSHSSTIGNASQAKSASGSRSSTTGNVSQAKSASGALQELAAIADSVLVRHNILALVLCNCLFLYDFHCARRYIDWKNRYRLQMRAWMETVGKYEALISLGVLSRTKDACSMPEVTASPAPVLCATDIRHPLIPESRAVGNDISLTHRTCIITGSNMSGKTTFLRSIGVNLALAYAGGYCNARAFSASLMELCTSMRAQDDVNEGVSTFYAELLRIKKMMELSQKQVPMISLIDEIYKGTNSKDRIYAARETVRNLSGPYALTLLTTHDLELCDLENDGSVDAENYHFTEHYEKNRILFDYQIRKGRCTTTNARYLLRMAGIIT